MTIVTVGIDLAKNVFAVHGVDATGKPVLLKPNVPRAKLAALIASLPPCLIGMEACSGAHHWARLFATFGHTVRLMAPKFVAPYRLSGKRGKNDAADAAAICEAVTRANMRFVPIKTLDQQGQLMVHRARQGFVEQRTATINSIRFWMFPSPTLSIDPRSGVERRHHLFEERLQRALKKAVPLAGIHTVQSTPCATIPCPGIFRVMWEAPVMQEKSDATWRICGRHIPWLHSPLRKASNWSSGRNRPTRPSFGSTLSRAACFISRFASR